MSSSFMMVAPSFEIVTFPCMHHQIKGQQHQSIHHSERQMQKIAGVLRRRKRSVRTLSSWTSLSIPRGPRVVLTVSTTAMHAFMLLISCGVPWLVSVPSLSRMIWGCCMHTYDIIFQAETLIKAHQGADCDR